MSTFLSLGVYRAPNRFRCVDLSQSCPYFVSLTGQRRGHGTGMKDRGSLVVVSRFGFGVFRVEILYVSEVK